MTYVKICGITELASALCALEAGADLVGFVFAPSRRQVTPEQIVALVDGCRAVFPPDRRRWQSVGVFANQPLGFVQDAAALCDLDIVQLSGEEPPEYSLQMPVPVFKAVHLDRNPGPSPEGLDELQSSHGATRLLLDSGGPGNWGGTGRRFRWKSIGDSARDCIVAGGLDAGNVADAISAMRPWGVDVSSGVESAGLKDPELIRRFIREVRRQDGHAGE